MVVQQNRNTIRNLTSADGIKLNTFSQISEEAISFFQNLLGTKDEQVTQCNVLPELIQSNLTDEAVAELCKPVYAEEVKESMFAIGDDKAPGPDGYTAHFFKKAWDIVGADVIDEVLSFFHTNKLNPAFNSTIIALVPKKQAPNSIRDYRPISCCSVIYKCITRILTTRMKKYMPYLISGNQSAFIGGRSIADNVLMAQELVRGYARKSLSPRCAIKVDLQKAFDSIDWRFLLDILTVMKFPAQFIGWIKGCITHPRFSISINGGLVGYFKGARGVRQGDPLSPYLFVIVMNALSKLLDAAAMHGVFQYHPKCKKVHLTHLCFADDLLIFTKGDVESVIGVQKVLQLFYSYSGLQINSAKCEMYYSGVSREDLMAIQNQTGFRLGTLPVRYLGVPLVTRRLTDKDCAPLVDKITAQINAWTSKFLSYAGRFQLIQTVIFSIQNYWCRHFILPKGVLRKVNQICARFFWFGQDKQAKGARVSWKYICQPKAEGGLGLKDSVSWNKACVMQNLWSIIIKAGSLWIAWINAYVLKGRSIWQIPISQSYSWNLRKILQLRPLAQKFVEWEDGAEIWKHKGCKYSAAAVWEEIRTRQGKQAWHRFIWASLNIPKHVFITWMAVLNRLPTMDRLASWGMRVDELCRFCQHEKETRDHIFFGCTFAKCVWKKVLEICGLSREIGSWEDELKWAVRKLKGKALVSIMLRLAWKATIYCLWRERNRRVYEQTKETEVQVLNHIKEAVRIKLMGLKNIANDSVNRLICSNLNLSLLV